MISGEPTSERRVLIASAGFSLFVGALLGYVIGEAIRALWQALPDRHVVSA